MALKLTRNRVLTGASLAVAATVTAVILTMDSTVPLPVQADIIIGPQTPIGSTWFDVTQVERGKFHGRNFLAEPPTSTDPALDPYILNNYYDLALALAIAHKRTGDAEFLTLYRKVADSWWKSPHIKEGTVRTFDTFTHTPRNASLGGLILRAMDGRPEMWDWINAYTRAQFNNWVKSRINDPQPYLGVRDGAFMLQDAAWLARVLPDSFPLQAGGTATNGAQLRAQYLADVELAATQYYGRLQFPDGSWRWDDPYATDADGGTLKGIMQPFMIGLLMDALIDVYDATNSESVKASIVTQVTKACRHLYSDGPYSTQFIPIFNVRLRGFHYTYHGGTTVNPTKYEKGDLPADFANWKPEWDVQNQRQPIALLVAAYAWSYQRTGDRYFLDAGNELWDSAYGSTDGVRNYMAGDAKSYNQNCRWAGSYLVWSGGGATQPSPSVSVQPTAIPTLGTESPANTRIPSAPQIIDSVNDVWTRLPNGNILRNGQNTTGVGSQLAYCQRIVYAFGTDSQWYKWAGGWQAVGVSDPCGMSPTPTISVTPTPQPTVQPSPSVQPLPSPSPSPVVTPKPSPSPSPTLPACTPNQIIGNPARCLCTTGVRCTGSNARCL